VVSIGWSDTSCVSSYKEKSMSPRWFHFAKHGDMVHLLCFMCSNQLSMIVNGCDMKIHSKEVHPGFQFCLYVQVF
jgi:hypothetical protein